MRDIISKEAGQEKIEPTILIALMIKKYLYEEIRPVQN
jgi:hypothetical protein